MYQAVPQYAPPAPAPKASFWSDIPPLVYVGVGACAVWWVLRVAGWVLGAEARTRRPLHVGAGRIWLCLLPGAPPLPHHEFPSSLAAPSSHPRPRNPRCAGVVLAGVLGKVVDLVRGGPQRMQQMMMEQAMKQMMKQMGGAGGCMGGRGWVGGRALCR